MDNENANCGTRVKNPVDIRIKNMSREQQPTASTLPLTNSMLTRRLIRFLLTVTQLPEANDFSTFPKSRTFISDNSLTTRAKAKTFSVGDRGVGVRAVSETMSFSSDRGNEEGHFKLSESSALVIKKGDITKWSVDGSSDAIVSAVIYFSFAVFIVLSWTGFILIALTGEILKRWYQFFALFNAVTTC